MSNIVELRPGVQTGVVPHAAVAFASTGRYVLRSHAMLQLYGNPRSRAMRCLWMLEEVGEPYELIEKSTRTDELQSIEYLRLNPNARIPTLVHGDAVLWESMGYQPLPCAKV